MRYIGGGTFTPADGWTFAGFAGTLLVAEHPDDPLTAGGLLFGPVTVEFEPAELDKLRASHARHQAAPDTERRLSGPFWDLWTLLPSGRIGRRVAERRKKKTDD